MLWTNRQEEVLGLLDVRAGAEVLEVGYGPGGLIRLLEPTRARRICGVDPSPQMRDVASRPHSEEVLAGRIDLRLGTAADTGFPDEVFDRVVSVNNVALWPDLGAGVAELHRVTRPGGRLLIACHGGTRPTFLSRSNALSEDKLDRIERALRGVFSEVSREDSTSLTSFTAVR
ncbi:methyltransferase domain-containing protein [Saccharopolyspora aridisoli]|uniref:Methyltransferase domain-containing protein n=1 Tax=Saccharopolyspora aridisoli TaxID=2530385 RepID=A0A4R4URU9_9PSEU|nr:methyltransferase domain-containing protein [Saccharopolyspora aridisoli]TDC91323.1 methyltransferase domain-containing protein [Saccharopolyspora aridisoli]